MNNRTNEIKELTITFSFNNIYLLLVNKGTKWNFKSHHNNLKLY